MIPVKEAEKHAHDNVEVSDISWFSVSHLYIQNSGAVEKNIKNALTFLPNTIFTFVLSE